MTIVLYVGICGCGLSIVDFADVDVQHDSMITMLREHSTMYTTTTMITG